MQCPWGTPPLLGILEATRYVNTLQRSAPTSTNGNPWTSVSRSKYCAVTFDPTDWAKAAIRVIKQRSRSGDIRSLNSSEREAIQ